jgi:plasmid replication initiation protein
MFDDVDRLRDNPRLVELLSHYAKLGEENRGTWQNRLMHIEGIEPKELSKLHGELIAFDWIEQNTGQASVLKEGVVSACYRITLHELRDLCRLQGVEYVEKKSSESQEPRTRRLSRKKKQQSMPSASIEFAVVG